MFKRTSKKSSSSSFQDFSNVLRDSNSYKHGTIHPSFGIQGDITAVAVDPLGGYLAVGTSCGSIHLTGSPAVYLSFTIYHSPPAPLSQGSTSIKFLCFHPGSHRLVAIDSKNQVHIWDLSLVDPKTQTPHKEATNSLYGKVTSIDLPSPSTSHLPLTFKDGTTAFIDLARSAFLSPYKIPNVWALHETRLRASGIKPASFRAPGRGQPMALGVSMNPRDRGLVLVGYEGGVILWDMAKREVKGSFELVIMPGAPGASTYTDPNLFTERTPGVTCLCWKPDGLVFAAGYDDGCIAIWSVDDFDKPLSVRTVDEEDVNVTNAESLFESGALESSSSGSKPSPVSFPREPIFKLTWTSFPESTALSTLTPPASPETLAFSRRQETILVVLGGQLPTAPLQGVTLLQFPGFKPPAAAVPPPSGGLSSIVRAAFKDSLISTGTFVYFTERPCEDFIMVPRGNPHFGMAFDPVSIVLIVGSMTGAGGPMSGRAIKAYSFPPVRSTEVKASATRRESVGRLREDELVPITAPPATLVPSEHEPSVFSPQAWKFVLSGSSDDPPPSLDMEKGFEQPFVGEREGFGEWRLPSQFWCGGDSVLGAWMKDLKGEPFRKLVGRERVFEGIDGKPRLRINGGKAEGRVDGGQFQGLKLDSHRILMTSHLNPHVKFYDISPHLLLFPSPLSDEYPTPLPHLSINVPAILQHPSLDYLSTAKLFAQDPRRVSIQSVELAKESLELAVILNTGTVIYYKFGPSVISKDPSLQSSSEITDLRHLSSLASDLDGFQPQFLLDVNRGPVGACAVSDAGFLAVSFLQNSLAVVDLREPEIILRDGFGEEGQTVRAEVTAVGALSWAVCGLASDSTPAIRLLASFAKGLQKVYTLEHGLTGWEINQKPTVFTHESLSSPLASFIIDASTGEELSLNSKRLDLAMATSNYNQTDGAARKHSVLILAGKRGIRSQMDLNGEKIGKVELMEDLKAVQLVSRHGSQVLVAFMERSGIHLYAVPSLDFISHIPLYDPVGKISMDTTSGDYFDYRSPMDLRLSTLFNFQKPLTPTITLDTLRPSVPAHPIPVQSNVVASLLGSWIGGPQTGAQIDTLIAGPNRPPPHPKPDFAPRQPDTPTSDRSPVVPRPARSTARPTASRPAKEDPFREMAEAAEERGNYLDGLQDTMKDVGRKASEWQEQARRTAMKESVKTSAKTFFRFG